MSRAQPNDVHSGRDAHCWPAVRHFHRQHNNNNNNNNGQWNKRAPWRRLAMIGDTYTQFDTWSLSPPIFINSSLPNWNPTINQHCHLALNQFPFYFIFFFFWVGNNKWKRFQGNWRSFTFCPGRWSATGEKKKKMESSLFGFGRTHCVTAKRISIYRRRLVAAGRPPRPTKGITQGWGGGNNKSYLSISPCVVFKTLRFSFANCRRLSLLCDEDTGQSRRHRVCRVLCHHHDYLEHLSQSLFSLLLSFAFYVASDPQNSLSLKVQRAGRDSLALFLVLFLAGWYQRTLRSPEKEKTKKK